METANTDVKIWVYVMCYNEIKLAPFVIDYWKTYADKVIIYDNGSTDGCLELFSKYDWIEVRHFDTNGLDDLKHVEIKNQCWKEARERGVDFVQVSDFDEVIFDNNLKKKLIEHRANGEYIFNLRALNVYSEVFPEYNEGKLLHTLPGIRFLHVVSNPKNKFEKAILFDPNIIKEINYEPGCHEASPIIFSDFEAKNTKTTIKKLHLEKLGLDFILAKKRDRLARNEENLKNGFGRHYTCSDEENIKTFHKAFADAKEYDEINW